jgi:hypothetical protein
LICNLQKRFEKEKKNFLIGNRLRGKFGTTQLATARAACALSRPFKTASVSFQLQVNNPHIVCVFLADYDPI